MYSQHHIKASANDTNLGKFFKSRYYFPVLLLTFLSFKSWLSTQRKEPSGWRWENLKLDSGFQTARVFSLSPFHHFLCYSWPKAATGWDCRGFICPCAKNPGFYLPSFFIWSHSNHKQNREEGTKKKVRGGEITVNKGHKNTTVPPKKWRKRKLN